MLLVNGNSVVQLYAYGTNSHTIRVRLYHMRMVCTIRVRYEIRVWYTTDTHKIICVLIKKHCYSVTMAITNLKRVAFDRTVHGKLIDIKFDDFG